MGQAKRRGMLDKRKAESILQEKYKTGVYPLISSTIQTTIQTSSIRVFAPDILDWIGAPERVLIIDRNVLTYVNSYIHLRNQTALEFFYIRVLSACLLLHNEALGSVYIEDSIALLEDAESNHRPIENDAIMFFKSLPFSTYSTLLREAQKIKPIGATYTPPLIPRYKDGLTPIFEYKPFYLALLAVYKCAIEFKTHHERILAYMRWQTDHTANIVCLLCVLEAMAPIKPTGGLIKNINTSDFSKLKKRANNAAYDCYLIDSARGIKKHLSTHEVAILSEDKGLNILFDLVKEVMYTPRGIELYLAKKWPASQKEIMSLYLKLLKKSSVPPPKNPILANIDFHIEEMENTIENLLNKKKKSC